MTGEENKPSARLREYLGIGLKSLTVVFFKVYPLSKNILAVAIRASLESPCIL